MQNKSKAKAAHAKKLREAVMRMKALSIPDGVVQDFATGNSIPVCLHGVNHIFYIARDYPIGSAKEAGATEAVETTEDVKRDECRIIDNVTKFERAHNALVYFVIYLTTSFGELESYLFVSDYEEEWEMDNADLKDGYAMTWTENTTHPNCSEFGSIGIKKTACGGLDRLS